MKLVSKGAQHSTPELQMELIPLINVFVALIMFLLLTTSLLVSQGIDVKLLFEPEAQESQTKGQSIDNNDLLFVLLTEKEMRLRVHAQGQSSSEHTFDALDVVALDEFLAGQEIRFANAFVRSQGPHTHQHIVSVIDRLRQSGATQEVTLSPGRVD